MADVQVTSAELRDGVLTVTGSGFTKTTTTLYVDGVETAFETAADFDGTEITVSSGLPPKGPPYEVYAAKGGIESARVQATDASAPAAGDGGPSAAPVDVGASTSESASTGSPDPSSPTDEASGSEAKPYDPGGDVHVEGYKTAEDNVTPGDLVEDDLKTTADQTPEQLADAGGAGAAEKQVMPEPNRAPLAEGEHLGEDFRFRVEGTAAEDITKTVDVRQPYPEGNPPDPRETYYLIHGHFPAEPEDNASPTPQPQPRGGS